MPATDAKTLLLEIIRKSDGEFHGKKRRFKAFYLAHLAYSDANPGLLTLQR